MSDFFSFFYIGLQRGLIVGLVAFLVGKVFRMIFGFLRFGRF